jgi:hypothetical protein
MHGTVLSKINEEHFKIRQLMKSVKESIDIEIKKYAFTVLKHELIEHMVGEEKSLYRYIQRLSLDHTYDHHEIKECLQRLNLMKMTDEEWDRAYQYLCQAVEDHCGDEEENLFCVVNNSFDDETLILMEREYNLGRLEAAVSM